MSLAVKRVKYVCSQIQLCLGLRPVLLWLGVRSEFMLGTWLHTYRDTETPACVCAHAHTSTHWAGQWPKGCGCAQHLPGAKLWMYPPLSSLLWANMCFGLFLSSLYLFCCLRPSWILTKRYINYQNKQQNLRNAPPDTETQLYTWAK